MRMGGVAEACPNHGVPGRIADGAARAGNWQSCGNGRPRKEFGLGHLPLNLHLRQTSAIGQKRSVANGGFGVGCGG